MKIGIIKIRKDVTYVIKDFVTIKMIFYTKKVRDHCHFTRKFRATALSIYNLRYKVPH